MSKRILLIGVGEEHHSLLREQLEQAGYDLEISAVSTVAQAAPLVKDCEEDCFSCLVLNIAVSPDRYSPFPGIPTIVMTGGVPVENRVLIKSRNILDFILDWSRPNREYMLQLLRRSEYLKSIFVLVIDDERTTRTLAKNLLINMGFRVLEAANGADGLKLLETHNIPLILCDNYMPKMDGFGFLKELRNKHHKHDVSVIGMVDGLEEYQVAQFIRAGANDCITKPFSFDVFHVRVMQNLEIVEAFREITELTRRDPLTSLYNRRYFFEQAHKLFANFLRDNLTLAIVMLDIDDFKKINDSYGHPVGDRVILSLARLLEENTREADLVSRFGGEEFCILLCGVDSEHVGATVERIRTRVEALRIPAGEIDVQYTVSIGVHAQKCSDLSEFVSLADQKLYAAKEQGKNRIVF